MQMIVFQKKKRSERQVQMLKFINGFIEEHHYPPTVRDIQFGCNISSTSVVDYNLRILHRDGLLRREAEVSRGIEVINQKKPEDVIEVPILGRIAAGEPLHIPPSTSWRDEAVDSVNLPPFLTQGKEDVFAVKVKGESMIDALVGDGDLVIMEPTQEAREGDMVAASLSDRDEVTLKHFHLANGTVTLQPANSSMQPIKVPAEKVTVKGRVIGVVRTV